MGGRGSDAVFVTQNAADAAPIAGKRLSRIEMNVLATEFSLIGIAGRIGSQATQSVFVEICGALARARAWHDRLGALSEGKWWATGNQKKQERGRSKRFHETRRPAKSGDTARQGLLPCSVSITT